MAHALHCAWRPVRVLSRQSLFSSLRLAHVSYQISIMPVFLCNASASWAIPLAVIWFWISLKEEHILYQIHDTGLNLPPPLRSGKGMVGMRRGPGKRCVHVTFNLAEAVQIRSPGHLLRRLIFWYISRVSLIDLCTHT